MEQIENKHAIFYGYGQAMHSKKRKPMRYTIAIVPTGPSSVNVGIAVCSMKDNFVKRIGRNIAAGRAQAKPTLVIEGSYWDQSKTETGANQIVLRNVDTTTVEGMLSLKKMLKDLVDRHVSIVCRGLNENQLSYLPAKNPEAELVKEKNGAARK